MSAPENKKTTTVRLSETTMSRLQGASRILRRSQSQLVEEALVKHLRDLGLDERYVLKLVDGYCVLEKHEGEKRRIVEVKPLNGLTPEAEAEKYSIRLHAPVDLVIEGERGETR